MRRHVISVINRQRAGLRTGVHQIAGHFCLAVDHHRLAAGETFQIDTLLAPQKGQRKPFMHLTLTIHPVPKLGFTQ